MNLRGKTAQVHGHVFKGKEMKVCKRKPERILNAADDRFFAFAAGKKEKSAAASAPGTVSRFRIRSFTDPIAVRRFAAMIQILSSAERHILSILFHADGTL